MATGAGSSRELDVGSGVDGQAVVLVLDIGTRDDNIGGAANIKSICIVTFAISSRVVHRDTHDVEIGSSIDRHELDGSVLDVQTLDGGGLERMGVEHLGFGLSTVAALSIPPLSTIAIDDMARCTRNGDVCAADADERALPFLVAEGGCSLENDLVNKGKLVCSSNPVFLMWISMHTYVGTGLQASQVQCGTGRNSNVVQCNGRT